MAARVQSGAALARPLYIETNANPRSGSCTGQLPPPAASRNFQYSQLVDRASSDTQPMAAGSAGKVEAMVASFSVDQRREHFACRAQLFDGTSAFLPRLAVSVDWVQVLATPGVDSHSTYVALSGHREQDDVYFDRYDFTS